MRKLCAILLCAALLLQLSIVTVFAADPVVSVSDASGKQGETVEVTIDLANCQGFANIGIEIEYDSDVLTITGVTNGEANAFFTKAQTMSANPYNMLWNSDANVVFDGCLATLQFEIAEDAPSGTYPLKVSYYKGRNGTNRDGVTVNYDENLESLGLTYVSGSITVEGDALPTGAYVKVSDSVAQAGETVDVTIDLVNCQGFANIGLEIEYDSDVLTLTEVKNGGANAFFTKAQNITAMPYNMLWNSDCNVVFEGSLVTLKFAVAEDAPLGEYPITVSYYKGRDNTNRDGVTVNYDENLESIGLSYVPGGVTVKPDKHILSVASDGSRSFVISAVSPDEMSGIFVVALYDGDKMVAVQMVNAQEELDMTFTEEGDRIKVMWFGSAEDMSPLCTPCEFDVVS